MVKKGSSSYSASSVARSGVTLSRSVEKIFALEAEVSRLRHHVSVLSRRLHFCGKEREPVRGAPGPRTDSPFDGDEDLLPPPPDEGVADAVAVVRLPSPGVEADGFGGFVAPSVALSVASSSVCFEREGVDPPQGGGVVGEVDSDDDFIMESAEPVVGPVVDGSVRSVADGVGWSDPRDGSSSVTPRPVGALAPGRSSEFVSWGFRRSPSMTVGALVASPHLCPVGAGGRNGARVRCPCGVVFERSRLGRHVRGQGGSGGCSRGDLFRDGRGIIAAWDVDLRCLVEGCPVGGVPFSGATGRICLGAG